MNRSAKVARSQNSGVRIPNAASTYPILDSDYCILIEHEDKYLTHLKNLLL